MIARAITDIVIHCAATPNGRPYTAAQIDRDHAARGFKRAPMWVKQFSPTLGAIGYHYYIGVDGLLSTGRHLEEVGAHVQGSNAHSIGIAMAGTNKFTAMEWITLKSVCLGTIRNLASGRVQQPYPIDTPDQAMAALAVMKIKLDGHRDYSPDLNGDGRIDRTEWMKECPGFDVATWLRAGMTAQPAHLC